MFFSAHDDQPHGGPFGHQAVGCPHCRGESFPAVIVAHEQQQHFVWANTQAMTDLLAPAIAMGRREALVVGAVIDQADPLRRHVVIALVVPRAHL